MPGAKKPVRFVKPGRKPKLAAAAERARLKEKAAQHEQAVRLLASEFRIDRHGMRKLLTQSGLTPGWAEKQLRYLQQLCEAFSKHHNVNLDWRSYPELVALRPQEMSKAVQNYALALASGKKPGLELISELAVKKPGLESAREAAAPGSRAPETDLVKGRSMFFGALLKHKGAAKLASEEFGYRQSEFSSRAAQLGVKPKIMKDAVTAYNVRKALIGKGGNVRAAASAYGTTTSYFGSLMKRFGIDAEAYRRAGAEKEKPQGESDALRKGVLREQREIKKAAPLHIANPTRKGVLREQREIKKAAPLHIANPTITIVAEGLKKGIYDDHNPPNGEALRIIERACSFDARLIQNSVGITYSVWHNWLARRKLVNWVDRESRLVRAQRDAEKERAKR